MFQRFYAKLTEKEKKIFYAAAGFIILTVFDFLFMQPVASKIKKIDSEIKEKTETIKRDVRILSYKDKILKEQDDFRVYGTGEDAVEEEVIAGFLKTVEKLVTESKVNLIKLNPGEIKPKKGFREYYATLECEGPWEDMVTFMHKIETTNELLKIVKVNISGKKTSPDQVSASMTLLKLIIDPKSIGNTETTGEDSELVSEAAALSQQMMQEYQAKSESKSAKKEGQASGGSLGESSEELADPSGSLNFSGEDGGAAPNGDVIYEGSVTDGEAQPGAQGGQQDPASKNKASPGQTGGSSDAGSNGNSKDDAKEVKPNKFDKTVKKETGGDRMQLDNFGKLWLRMIGKDPSKVKAAESEKSGKDGK